MLFFYQNNNRTLNWPRKSDIMDKVGWSLWCVLTQVWPSIKFSLQFPDIIKQVGDENWQNHHLRDNYCLYRSITKFSELKVKKDVTLKKENRRKFFPCLPSCGILVIAYKPYYGERTINSVKYSIYLKNPNTHSLGTEQTSFSYRIVLPRMKSVYRSSVKRHC